MATSSQTVSLEVEQNGGILTITYVVFRDDVRYPSNPCYVICDLCGKEMGCTSGGNLNSFGIHRGSDRCRKAARKRERLREKYTASHAQLNDADSILMPPPAVPITTDNDTVLATPRPRNPYPSLLPDTPSPSPLHAPHVSLDLPPSSPSRSTFTEEDRQSNSSQLWGRSSSIRANTPTIEYSDPVDGEDPPPDTHEFQACKGVCRKWTPGIVWNTYPFDMHRRHKLPWEFIGSFAKNGVNFVRLLSTKCGEYLRSVKEMNAGVCGACASVPRRTRFKRLVERMTKTIVSPRTSYDYLSRDQIIGLLRSTKAQLHKVRDQANNLRRRLLTAQNKLEDQRKIMTFISEHDVPGLRRLLAVSLRRGASARTLFSRLEECVRGMYAPQGDWSQRDFDIAFIAKALGGPRLLYALQRAFGLPSVTNLNRNHHVPELRPCLSTPTSNDIEHNITTMFDSRKPPSSESIRKAGRILMMDGVAMEEVCRYDEQRDSVLGLCREHSCHLGDLSARDLEAIQLIERAIEGGTCHIGKDATVLALASIADPEDYIPVPILVSGSCKKETNDDLVRWLQLVLAVWRRHPQGESLHGPIMTIASDGESSFRAARFKLAMSDDLDTTTGFGRVLSQLPGLNLKTGHFGLLGTCDPKHIFKRFATLLRSLAGVQVDETTVTTVQIVRHLSTEISPDEAADLMDPADKQNVPKAVKLVQKLAGLSDQSETLVETDTERLRKISFLARTLNYFILPFTSSDMSLSDQITSLSTYAHLTYAMYKKSKLGFLTGALYADSHAVIKNIIFTVARLKEIDPSLLYFIILEGTDRLEMLFSNLRTQDHSRNFDLLQLVQKLSVAAELVAAFLRQHDLDRGHRRRDLKDAEGIDHVNPASIRQDNKAVGDVDLPAVWRKGREQAEEILKEYLGSSYDFTADFQRPNCDMLRPDGESYVGSRYTEEDDLSEIGHRDAADEAASLPPPVIFGDLPPEGDSADEADAGADVGQYFNGLEDWLSQTDEVSLTATLSSLFPSAPAPSTPASSTPASSAPLEPSITHSKTICIDGKDFRKDSYIPSTLRSDSARKATIRPLRAAGVTQKDVIRLHTKRFELPRLEADNIAAMHSGDLVGTLVQVGADICLAVVEVLHFERAGSHKQLYELEIDDISEHVTAICQVIALEADITPVPTDPSSSSNVPPLFWTWNKGYHTLDASAKIKNQKNHLLRVKSSQLHGLVHDYKDVSSAGRLLYRRTFSHAELQETLDYVWESMNPSSAEILKSIATLPLIKNIDALPYRDTDRKKALFVENNPVTDKLKKKAQPADSLPCKLCGASFKLNAMRNHVGGHILSEMCGLTDNAIIQYGQKVGIEPCGWCGLDGCHTAATISQKSGKKQVSLTSNCDYRYPSMSYKAALSYSDTTPCTNVPLHCTLCQPPQTIWKYNAVFHLASVHSYKDNLPTLPDDMWRSLYISKKEEKKLGIATARTDSWRRTWAMPGSDFTPWDEQADMREGRDEDILGEEGFTYLEHGDSGGGITRPQTLTVSSSGRPRKQARR